MDHFAALDGSPIEVGADIDQLKVEHILQRDRDVWHVFPQHPFLRIDADLLRKRIAELTSFPVFSSALIVQNVSGKDFGSRLIGSLAGGGVNAGFGPGSQVFVDGKANAKTRFLFNANAPLITGGTPWCADSFNVIYVDGTDLFQHKYGELIVVDKRSRTSSKWFDFTPLLDLRDRYCRDYFSLGKDSAPNLPVLEALLDDIFVQNRLSLTAAEEYHRRVSPTMVSNDYEAPVLTKYCRPTHDSSGQPKIEVSFALLHYETALRELDAIKKESSAGNLDEAFRHGVYCLVAVAASIEAVANKLVFLQQGQHPDHRDKRTPLKKLNDSAAALATAKGATYTPLCQGDGMFDALDSVRVIRNSFMHAKELESDIDPTTLASTILTDVNEGNCRNYLQQLRLAVEHVFTQFSDLGAPIVTKKNVTWFGEIEVP
ncbi:hypothetical protein [Cupriavidus taiwanensis]|nr:hypothetical protein [Cupriavidus taiwanensis]